MTCNVDEYEVMIIVFGSYVDESSNVMFVYMWTMVVLRLAHVQTRPEATKNDRTPARWPLESNKKQTSDMTLEYHCR